MIRKNKWGILLSSIITLLPALFGWLVWDQLPERITIHWGADGQADGWGTRLFAVLILPAILLVLHLICILITAKDHKHIDQNGKIIGIVLGICPAISLYTGGIVYATAFGLALSVTALSCVLFGLLFVIMGNYLPKCKQNRTIGIKLPWTLADEENWNATHRAGGKMMVVAGLLILLCIFLPTDISLIATLILTLALVIVISVYSYLYHRKQQQNGQDTTKTPK